MPVFNIAANTRQLTGPGILNPYYEGQAARANIAAREKQTEQMDDRLQLDKEALGLRRAELASRIAEGLGKRSKEEQEATVRGALAAFDVYENEGDEREATEAFASAYGPGFAEAMGDTESVPYEFARAVVAGAGKLPDDDETNPQKASFIGDDGKAHVGFFDPVRREYTDAAGNVHTKAQPIAPAATQEDISGLASGDKAKDRQAVELVTSAEQLTGTIDRISTQIGGMEQSALGLPGATTKALEGAVHAVRGFKDLVGGWAEIEETGEKVTDEQLLDPALYEDYFRGLSGPAAQSAALQANAIGLAYTLARAANPDGRISDADVRHQMERFNLGSSSKPQIQAALFEVKHEIIRNAAIHLRVGGYTRTERGKELYDDFMTRLEVMEGDKPTDGLQIGRIEDGYRFLGGDPALRESWERVEE